MTPLAQQVAASRAGSASTSRGDVASRPGRTPATGTGAASATTHVSGPLPRSVAIAAVIQLIEAVGILVASIIAGVDAITGKAYQHSSGVAITVIGVATALALGYVAHGLRRGRRWSRTPAMLTQLFVGIVGIYLVQAPRLEWGIPALALAVGGLVAIFLPASMKLLTPGRPD